MQVRKEWVVPSGVGLGSFIIGTGVGYAISEIYNRTKRSKIEKRNLELASRESNSSDEDVESRRVEVRFEYEEAKREFSFIIQQANYVIKAFKEATEQLTQGSVDAHPSSRIPDRPLVVVPTLFEEPTISVRVFTEEDDDWDYDKEVLIRNPERPYIIHRDEFDENEHDWDHSTLMYYEGDDILCDEKDVPIYDKEKVVGKLIFGHGSRDPSICYVRNEKLEAEYEVIVDHGYFQVQVLGQHAEDVLKTNDLKHHRQVHKFRME